jgi:HSP20 family protein
MFGLTRWTEPRGISRLRQDMDELFDRFFDREDWMPGRMMRSMRSFQRDLDTLFGSFFGEDWGVLGSPEEAGTFWPRVETALADGEQVLRLEVPGFTAENIQLHMAGTTLRLQGERKLGDEKEGTSQRRFSITYTLPEVVEPDKVRATLANGILEIRVPVSPTLAGKKIPVQVGAGEEKKQLKAA